MSDANNSYLLTYSTFDNLKDVMLLPFAPSLPGVLAKGLSSSSGILTRCITRN